MQLKVKKDGDVNPIIDVKLITTLKSKKMNLKELKAMIKEEWEAHQNEQALPGVAVSDADVDATGGDEDAEETLRDIFNMLKDYFEGGDDTPADDAPADDADDDDKDDEVKEGMHDEDDKNEGKKDKEDLKERFKKLANIIKG